MIKKIVLSFLIFCRFIDSYSQNEAENFEPSGKIIARSSMDFSTGLNSNSNDETGFDITRAFLGYNYKINPTLDAQVIIDAASGKNADGKSEVHLRNAYLRWRDLDFDIKVGEIGLLQFSLQETYWAHRYVLMSFQDLNKMAPSVDVGVTVQHKFNSLLSADLSITNGEGYKKVEKNKSSRYATGLTLSPTESIVLRAYGDLYNDGADARDKLPQDVTCANYENQYSLALFGGYMNNAVSCGIEYNKVFNKGFIAGKSYFGYSAYSSVRIMPQWRIYARYDSMGSNPPANFSNPWNSLDGQLMVTGIEFHPVKQVKISPNFRNINPDRQKVEQYIFLNLEFDL